MMNFLKLQLEIRHSDWPYILQGFISYFVLSYLGYLLFGGLLFLYFIITISLIFVIITAVHFNNLRRAELQHLQYKVQAIHELIKLIPLRAPLPPMTGWAATPELALNVYKTIQEEKPVTIAELGSGITTIISAYALEKFSPDGAMLSFDHCADFENKTRTELKLHQLEKYVEIVHAPLVPFQIQGKEWNWYDIDFFRIQKQIDLLIIDGPPIKTQKNARYPALPAFYSKLSDQAVIILHDTNRDTESYTIKKWMDEFPDLSKSFLKTEKGITFFKKETNH